MEDEHQRRYREGRALAEERVRAALAPYVTQEDQRSREQYLASAVTQVMELMDAYAADVANVRVREVDRRRRAGLPPFRGAELPRQHDAEPHARLGRQEADDVTCDSIVRVPLLMLPHRVDERLEVGRRRRAPRRNRTPRCRPR
jgi:hypothetical protein